MRLLTEERDAVLRDREEAIKHMTEAINEVEGVSKLIWM